MQISGGEQTFSCWQDISRAGWGARMRSFQPATPRWICCSYKTVRGFTPPTQNLHASKRLQRSMDWSDGIHHSLSPSNEGRPDEPHWYSVPVCQRRSGLCAVPSPTSLKWGEQKASLPEATMKCSLFCAWRGRGRGSSCALPNSAIRSAWTLHRDWVYRAVPRNNPHLPQRMAHASRWWRTGHLLSAYSCISPW